MENLGWGIQHLDGGGRSALGNTRAPCLRWDCTEGTVNIRVMLHKCKVCPRCSHRARIQGITKQSHEAWKREKHDVSHCQWCISHTIQRLIINKWYDHTGRGFNPSFQWHVVFYDILMFLDYHMSESLLMYGKPSFSKIASSSLFWAFILWF